MSATPDPRDLTTAAIADLRASGPSTGEDWAQRLVDAGHGSLPEMTKFVELLDHPSVVLLADGRTAVLDTLLEGRVFTHRLSGGEIESGLLHADPDLAPVVMSALGRADESVRVLFPDYDADELAALGIADEHFPDGPVLLFGTEALQGFSSGDLIAVTVGAGGSFELSSAGGDVADVPDMADRLDRIVGADNADNLETVAWQLLADDDALCATPTMPLGELIEAAGYECEGDYIAARGFDFDAHHLAAHIAMVAREHELHPDEASAVVSFVQLVGIVHDDELDLPEVLARVGEDADSVAGLEDPAAAAAVLDLVNAVEDDYIPALYTTASAVVGAGPRRAKASGHWLAGMAADTLGDVLEAERHFADAAAMDEEWTRHCSNWRRSRPTAATHNGTVTAGPDRRRPDERLYDVLTRFAPAEHPELGRNDKCWCGSGRKYKVCHLGKADATLDDRASWLYEKATLYAQSTVLFDLVLGLAQRRAAHWDDEDAVARVRRAPRDRHRAVRGRPVRLFVARRGVLLPADERELADAGCGCGGRCTKWCPWTVRPRRCGISPPTRRPRSTTGLARSGSCCAPASCRPVSGRRSSAASNRSTPTDWTRSSPC